MSFFDDPKGFCKTNNVKVIGGEIVPDDRAFTRLSAPRCYQLKDDKKISKGAITDSNPPGLKELRVGTNGTAAATGLRTAPAAGLTLRCL